MLIGVAPDVGFRSPLNEKITKILGIIDFFVPAAGETNKDRLRIGSK
jgi:hypothetical protein